MKILAVTLSLPWRKEHAVVKLLESADPGLITVAQTRRDGGENIQISCLYFQSLMKMFMRICQNFVKMHEKVFFSLFCC